MDSLSLVSRESGEVDLEWFVVKDYPENVANSLPYQQSVFNPSHLFISPSAVVLYYVYYIGSGTESPCTEHKAFISVNLILCVIFTVISVMPKVGLITKYCYY